MHPRCRTRCRGARAAAGGMEPASSAQRRAARLEARAARAQHSESRDKLGSGYRISPYRVECPTTIEPHPLFSFQGREPCPICLDDLCLAPAVALPCSGKHAFHVKCLKEVVTRNPNPTCPTCRSPFIPTLLYATDGAARKGWQLASPSKQAVPTWVPASPADPESSGVEERLAAEYRAARSESPPLENEAPLLRALADADRFGGRVVGEEVEAAARENMSVCAGSFLV